MVYHMQAVEIISLNNMCGPCVAVMDGNINFSKNRSEGMDDKINTESSHSTVLKPDCYKNRTTIRYGSG